MSHFKKRVELLKRPAFFAYILSCLFASFGNGMGYIALSWFVASKYQNINAVVILIMCFWLPNVFLSPVFGVFADRFDRKSLNIFSALARCAVFMALFVYLFFGSALIVVYGMMLLVGVFFSLYFSGVFAFVRELVPAEDLMHANASIDMAYEVGNTAGMGLSGLIMALFTFKTVILINSMTFLLVSVCLFLIPRSALRHGSKLPTPKMAFVQDFKSGLAYLFSRRALLGVYSVQLFIGLIFMTAPVILVPFSKVVLHANVAQFGRIEAMLSVGVVIGGLIVPWIADRLGFFRTLFVLIPVLAVSFLLFSLNRSLLIADVLYFIIGFAGAVWPVILTRAQNLTAIEYQGRVQSTYNSLAGAVTMLCYLSFAGIGQGLAVQRLYWVLMLMPILALMMLLSFKSSLSRSHAA